MKNVFHILHKQTARRELLAVCFVSVLCALLACLSLWSIGVAQRTQETLIAGRVGLLFDGASLFVPAVLEDQNVLRTRLRSLVAEHAYIDAISVFAPHGNGAWRLYVATSAGAHEGSVEAFDSRTSAVADIAWHDPHNTYTLVTGSGRGRTYTTIRAIENTAGVSSALMVATSHLSDADKRAEKYFLAEKALVLFMTIVAFALFLATSLHLSRKRG